MFSFFGNLVYLTVVDLVFLYRHNSSGAISSRQLGDAAHRLVVNSLNVDRNGYGNQMHAPPQSYPVPPYRPPLASYQNDRGHDQVYNRIQPPRTFQPPRGHHQSSNSPTALVYHEDGYNPPYVSSAAHHSSSRSHPQNYDRNNQPVTHSKGEYSRNVNYPSAGLHQNGGPMYASRQMVQPPNVAPAHSYQVGYNPYQNYQPPGASTHQQQRGNWAPVANQRVPGGYGRPQQPGNQYSALDRRANKGPAPPPGYGRK